MELIMIREFCLFGINLSDYERLCAIFILLFLFYMLLRIKNLRHKIESEIVFSEKEYKKVPKINYKYRKQNIRSD